MAYSCNPGTGAIKIGGSQEPDINLVDFANSVSGDTLSQRERERERMREREDSSWGLWSTSGLTYMCTHTLMNPHTHIHTEKVKIQFDRYSIPTAHTRTWVL